jgi:putative transposase
MPAPAFEHRLAAHHARDRRARPRFDHWRAPRKSRYSDEQIAAALRQAEAGTPIADITRKLGISEATFYAWRKRFGSLGTPEIRELRQLRDENARLKRLVADLTLDRQILQDVVKKSGEKGAANDHAAEGSRPVARERTARVRGVGYQS